MRKDVQSRSSLRSALKASLDCVAKLAQGSSGIFFGIGLTPDSDFGRHRLPLFVKERVRGEVGTMADPHSTQDIMGALDALLSVAPLRV